MYVGDSFEYILNVVVHCSYLVKPFFCGGKVEFAGIVNKHSAWIKGIEASVYVEFVDSSGCGVVGKDSKR